MNIQIYPLEIQHGFSSQGSLVLILAEPKKGRIVPVLIGYPEAQGIILAQEQTATKRPMTHQLIINMMKEYGLTLEQVVIDKFNEGIFYATLYINDGFNRKTIDSRTSDAIALALLKDCPIYIDEAVFDETSVDSSLMDNSEPKNQQPPDLTSLEDLLKRYEEEENFEKAEEVLKAIEKLKGINFSEEGEEEEK